jgi:Sir2- and TIR-associating SLOG family
LACEFRDILLNLERRYKAKSVFISGAAHEWGPKWPAERARALVRGLSKELVQRGYRLVSGFGYCVGSSTIAGALEHIYATKRGKIEDQLILRPLPGEHSSDPWEKNVKRYREDMADYAGAAVFLFGNKLRDGQVVLSDGVAQEFDICKEKGLALIPVGATGYMAEELWNKVMADLPAYYSKRTAEFQPLLETLGNADAEPTLLIDAIIRTLDLWSQS